MFEIQAEERAIDRGIVVDNTGASWRERGGGICSFGWNRSVLERTEDGVIIRLMDEEVTMDLSEYEGSCSASEETAELLDGNCAEAEILDGIAVDGMGEPAAMETDTHHDGTNAAERVEHIQKALGEDLTAY